MTDAQAALAQVRDALAAGPTPGPWVTMPANAGVHCVARINAWEAVPPSDCELSHDSIDASFIAACSPANMTAILAHVEAQKAEIERLTAERDELRRQLAEAEQDARRYRWLRANREFCVATYPEGEWVIPAGMVFLGYSNPDADSWIDAAMGASNE
jgi:hypothetical protein